MINNMSNASSTIFVPSRSSSPTNKYAGSTPYIVLSPPPDSPTDLEAAWPHQQMIEHIACLLNVGEDEVQAQFPTNCSLLPIDCSPPCASSPIFVPPTPLPPFIPRSPIGPYPRSELAEYADPNFPSEPPSSSESLPFLLPHKRSTLIVTAEGPQYNSKKE